MRYYVERARRHREFGRKLLERRSRRAFSVTREIALRDRAVADAAMAEVETLRWNGFRTAFEIWDEGVRIKRQALRIGTFWAAVINKLYKALQRRLDARDDAQQGPAA